MSWGCGGGGGGKGWREEGRERRKGRKRKGEEEKKRERENDLLSICAVVNSKNAQLGKCVHLNFELAWVLCN